jgi:hypothetical protein
MDRPKLCKDILNHIPIVVLDSGFDLYHLTFKNTPSTREQLEKGDYYNRLSELPEGEYLEDLEHPKYYSISSYHPLYYTQDPYSNDNVFIHYKTVRPLVLFDGRNYAKHKS